MTETASGHPSEFHWPRLLHHVPPVATFLLLAALAYSNTLQGAFVFDDVQQITGNPLIRNLSNYLWSGAGYRALPNRFVAYLTFALNYHLGGLDVTGFHAFNLAIHLANAVLVYALVVLTLRTPRLAASPPARSPRSVAFVTAALFATHPLQTQAVTYIVQRLTSLASFFYLLAVLLYAQWRLGSTTEHRSRAKSVTLYGLLLLLAIAAMRTKEIAFTLPFAVALYEFSFFEGGSRRRLIGLLPMLTTASIIPISLINLHQPLGQTLSDVSTVTRVQAAVSRLDYLQTQWVVIATYLRLLVYPASQNLDYDFPVYRSFLTMPVLGSLALLLALMGLAIWLHRRTTPVHPRPLDPSLRLVSFGIGWFFLTLAVESSAIPIVDVIYEHRVYLPSFGLFAAAATASALLFRKISRENPPRTTVLAGLMMAVLLAALTLQRNSVWMSDLSLWSDAVAKSPRKSRPHINLGTALIGVGRFDEAIIELRTATRLDPDSAWAHSQLAAALLARGLPAEAEPELRMAIRLKPSDTEAVFNLAMMLWSSGRRDEARLWFRRFLEIAPTSYVSARRLAAARTGP